MNERIYTVAIHGDLLEKQASQFILTHIPGYELVWQRYIGHNGQGRMALLLNASEEDEAKRASFAQHHYTILESVYFMQMIADDYSMPTSIYTFEAYRRVANDLMAFQAYSGRLRDNVEKCGLILVNDRFANELILGLSGLYAQRHVFIHGCKVPFSINDGVFMMPLPKRNTDSRQGYGQSDPWYRITSSEMVEISKFLSEVMSELCPIVNGILHLFLPKVKELMEARGLALEPPRLWDTTDTRLSSDTGPQMFISASAMPATD